MDQVPAAPFFLELVEAGLVLEPVAVPEEDDEKDLPCAFAYVFLFVKGLGNKREGEMTFTWKTWKVCEPEVGGLMAATMPAGQ